MDDPNGWPDEAEKVLAAAADPYMHDALTRQAHHDFRRDVLSALAPLLAARVAEARAKALEEAAAIAKRMFPHPTRDEYCDNCKDGHTHPGGDDLASAILALKEQAAREGGG